ncbi:MAG: response regulator [Kordiimonadaceae bacterium]|nr:response regulator [Kordiimonadaceae bacterium]
MDKIYLAQLQLLSAIVGTYFLLLSAIHIWLLDPLILFPVVAASLSASGLSYLIYCIVRFKKLPARFSHLAFVPVALAATTSTFFHITLSGDELQMTHAFVIVVVFGIVTLSPVLYSVALLVSGSAFFWALYSISAEHNGLLALMLLIMMTLSSLGFVLKFRTIYKSVILVNSNRSKALSLSVASRQIKEKMVEIQKANTAKDQFIANVTHELRTPLTGTMGMLDLLQATALDEKQQFMVTTAQKSANYLLGVVNDMLALGMIDACKMELSQNQTDLCAVTQQVMDEYRFEAEAKNISLTRGKSPANTVFVKGDAARLSQVLSKLISNAVKFTEEGGVIVSLNWEKDEGSATGCATWKIADTGPGIPPHHIDAMFDRFEQIDRTITRSSAGAGLGLAVVKEIVELMGGTVDVKSDLDKGTVFTIAVSLAVWTDEPDVITDEAMHETIENLYKNRPLSILLAEDNYVNQLVITRMLEKLGAEVTIVENGQLAVDAVNGADTPFDLICMDIQMPIMDGLSAAKVIKMRSSNKQSIIAVTANTNDHDIREYRSAGIEAVVTKPIDFNHFRAVLYSVLEAQRKQTDTHVNH